MQQNQLAVEDSSEHSSNYKKLQKDQKLSKTHDFSAYVLFAYEEQRGKITNIRIPKLQILHH